MESWDTELSSETETQLDGQFSKSLAGSKKCTIFLEKKPRTRATAQDYHCKSNYALLLTTTIIENLLGFVAYNDPHIPHCPRALVLCVVVWRLSFFQSCDELVLQNCGEFGWTLLPYKYTIFLFRQKTCPQMGYYLLHS